jgi:hypothetical protein
VRAKIFDCGHLVVLRSVKHNALAADLATQRFFMQLSCGTGHIPGVFEKHEIVLFGMRCPAIVPAGIGKSQAIIQYTEYDSLYGMMIRDNSPF